MKTYFLVIILHTTAPEVSITRFTTYWECAAVRDFVNDEYIQKRPSLLPYIKISCVEAKP